MKRRDFIALLGGTAAAWPLAAGAEQSGKIWRLGLISGGSRAAVTEFIAAFLEGMKERGYIENKNFVTDWRFADGNYGRFEQFVADLVQSEVDVIVLTTSAAVPIAQKATKTIPIVMVNSTDPVGNGFIASLARPGGNITGLASSTDDTSPKQIELLIAIFPNLSRIALLTNPDNSVLSAVLKKAQAAAESAGVVVLPVSARDEEEIESAFVNLKNLNVGAVMVGTEATFMTHRQKIAKLALNSRLPSIFVHREYVQAGGLMSYGDDLKDYLRYSAKFVDKILKGAKPADLPVEQPTKFRFTINLKTAKALGLTVPPQLLARADEVIE